MSVGTGSKAFAPNGFCDSLANYTTSKVTYVSASCVTTCLAQESAPTPSHWQSLLWYGSGLLLWLQLIACCGRRHSATCRKLRGVRRAWRNCYVWLRWFSRVMLDSSSAKDNLTANKGCAPRTPLLLYTRLPPHLSRDQHDA